MLQMIKWRQVLLIFSFSFISFILGWLLAVFIPPGVNLQEKKTKEPPSLALPAKTQALDSSQSNPGSQKFINPALFKEIKDFIFILFDPYKIDSSSIKNTLLEKKTSFINQNKPIKPSEIKAKKTKAPPIKPPPPLADPILEKESIPSDLLVIDPKIKKIREEYDRKNREQLSRIETEQNFFKSDGKFSFLVNVFSEEEKAFKYINKMRRRHPLWSFLLKTDGGGHIRVYLGPFADKEAALKFKKSLSIPYPFSSLEYLEEIAL